MRSTYATLVFGVVLSALLTIVAWAKLTPTNWGVNDENVIVSALVYVASVPLKSTKAKENRNAIRIYDVLQDEFAV
jgi:hypothetical protein